MKVSVPLAALRLKYNKWLNLKPVHKCYSFVLSEQEVINFIFLFFEVSRNRKDDTEDIFSTWLMLVMLACNLIDWDVQWVNVTLIMAWCSIKNGDKVEYSQTFQIDPLLHNPVTSHTVLTKGCKSRCLIHKLKIQHVFSEVAMTSK